MSARGATAVLNKSEDKRPAKTFLSARDLPILLLYVLLGFVFLLPGSLHMGRAILGYPGDSFQHAWFLWHFARAVSHGQNPYFTNLIFYPNRVNLAWSTLDPVASLLALPFSLLAGPIAAYNLSLILQLALAALFAYLLCLRICANRVAAVIGGVCFGFSPWMMGEALGHLSLVTAFPIPLYFLALDTVLRRANGRWSHGIFLGISLFMTALAHYNYTVFCVLLSLLIFVIDLAIDGWRLVKDVWRPVAGGAVTFAILFLPLFFSMWGVSANRPRTRQFQMIEAHSADLFGLFVPSWKHLLFGTTVRHWNVGLFSAGYEGIIYLGPVILVLAGIGLWTSRGANQRWAIRLAVSAVIFWALSLGPYLRVWGSETRIPGPALLFYLTPFGRYVSAPARFYVIAVLCCACMAAMGLAHLLSKTSFPIARRAIVAGVSVLLAMDLLTLPFPAATSVASERYAGFAAATEGCKVPRELNGSTVVTIPELTWPYPVRAMWMQIRDGGEYALTEGYVSYGPDSIWNEYWRVPVLRSLRSVQEEKPIPLDIATVRASMPEAIRRLNLGGFVVFDSAQGEVSASYLRQILGQPGERQATCTVFNVRQANGELPAASSVPFY
ncbi:MAG: hypothetical protein ACRD40_07495 [Candidatus Acidiferrales bacterium]